MPYSASTPWTDPQPILQNQIGGVYGFYNKNLAKVNTNNSPCSGGCCDGAGCSSSGCGGGPAPVTDGSYCNDQCCEWQYALGYMPGGCTCDCSVCEKCGNDSKCEFDDTHCQCQQFAPECQTCEPNGQWIDDPNCQKKETKPEESQPCICPQLGDDYCKFTCSINIQAGSYPVGPICPEISSPNGWALVNVSCSGGFCLYSYCSNGSGLVDKSNCRRPNGDRCCYGDVTPECVCSHTSIEESQRWCGQRICLDQEGVPGVTIPPSWTDNLESISSGKFCYRETRCTPFEPGVGECKQTCPDDIKLDSCECVSCHCHGDCPPDKHCVNGECLAIP